MKIADVLSLIDSGVIALPEFQRGYVWNRDQVRRLMGSLYRGHPVGSLLVWVTKTGVTKTRGSDAGFGTVELLLDGQQRITTLYGVIRGKPPKFFQGDKKAFLDLYFNVVDETFEFYGPVKMQDNPLWVSVTTVMQKGAVECIDAFYGHPEHGSNIKLYLGRLNALEKIQDREVHAEKITGEDKTIDVVVDIFNEINSGGTKLSKGDLALARICAEWPDARDEMRKRLSFWRQRGFDFELDWLLRNVTAVSTGQAMFAGLKDVDASKFQQDLAITENAINSLLNLVSGRLGLDHDRVLAGRYAFPVMCRYLVQRGGKLNSKLDQDRILFWYIHSFMWGRYAGSTETILNQDLAPLGDLDHAFDQLIKQLRLVRGDLTVRSEDFGGWSTGARFYPMLYLLTRVMGARDWGNGLPLSANLLGKLNSLQVHHIFPKAKLYKGGFHKRDVNAVANYCLLTADTNLGISDKLPEIYFPEIEGRHPGALVSQWIPMDPALWKINRYMDFLEARKALLAIAANKFLNELLAGNTLATPHAEMESGIGTTVAEIPATGSDLQPLLDWITLNGLPSPQVDVEITMPGSSEVVTVADAFWPNGLQPGRTPPTVLLLSSTPEEEARLAKGGMRTFTHVESLRGYLEGEVLTSEEAAA